MDFDKYSDLENHGYFLPSPKKTNYAGNFLSGYKAAGTLINGSNFVIRGLFLLAFVLLKGLYSILYLLASAVAYLIATVHKKGRVPSQTFLKPPAN